MSNLYILDPVSVLEYATTIQKKAQRVVDLEIENKQLRDTLDEYNHEFAEVKNQGKNVLILVLIFGIYEVGTSDHFKYYLTSFYFANEILSYFPVKKSLYTTSKIDGK